MYFTVSTVAGRAILEEVYPDTDMTARSYEGLPAEDVEIVTVTASSDLEVKSIYPPGIKLYGRIEFLFELAMDRTMYAVSRKHVLMYSFIKSYTL